MTYIFQDKTFFSLTFIVFFCSFKVLKFGINWLKYQKSPTGTVYQDFRPGKKNTSWARHEEAKKISRNVCICKEIFAKNLCPCNRWIHRREWLCWHRRQNFAGLSLALIKGTISRNKVLGYVYISNTNSNNIFNI